MTKTTRCSTATYDPLAYGAVGNGVSDDSSAVVEAISAVPLSGGTVLLSRPFAVDQNVLIPAHVVVRFEREGRLLPRPGKAIGIEGAVDAPLMNIFDPAADIRFGACSTAILIPQWWGARGDGIHDDTEALLAAVEALPRRGGHLRLPGGTYVVTQSILLSRKRDFQLSFDEMAWLRHLRGTHYTLNVSACSGFKLRNVRVCITDSEAAGAILVNNGSCNGLIEKPVIQSFVPLTTSCIAISVEGHSRRNVILAPRVCKLSATLDGEYAAGIRFIDGCVSSYVVGASIESAATGIIVDDSSKVSEAGSTFKRLSRRRIPRKRLFEQVGSTIYSLSASNFLSGIFSKLRRPSDQRITQVTTIVP